MDIERGKEREKREKKSAERVRVRVERGLEPWSASLNASFLLTNLRTEFAKDQHEELMRT